MEQMGLGKDHVPMHNERSNCRKADWAWQAGYGYFCIRDRANITSRVIVRASKQRECALVRENTLSILVEINLIQELPARHAQRILVVV